MSNPLIGIDISHYQGAVPPGPWLFVVHAVGDGVDFTDPDFAARFPTITGLRGAYTYARPAESDGKTAAQHFAVAALGAGFKKDVDIWQLDCEGGENAGVSGATWRQFINEFMWTAYDLLGRRAFLYAGWPFLDGFGLDDLVGNYQWWLPDYGVNNDGQIHPVQTPVSQQQHIVLHQFTSAGNLDQNVVFNWPRWAALISPPPQPAPKPNPLLAIAAFLKALATRPMKFGDSGPRVQKLNALLAKRGLVIDPTSDVYDETTAECVGCWKWWHRLKNQDPKVCGVACFTSLLRA